MHSSNICKLLGAFFVLIFVKLIHAAPLTESDLNFLKQPERLGQGAAFNGTSPLNTLQNKPLDQANYLKTKSRLLKDTFLTTTGNPTFNEMFDNITDHYITYSRFLETASTKIIMELRLKAMKFYTDPATYASVESKFDNFVIDFRSTTAGFDRFAFNVIDFLIFPNLGVEFYSAIELARIRTEMISTIPLSASPSQRGEFIGVIDTILSQFPNGKNLGAYFIAV